MSVKKNSIERYDIDRGRVTFGNIFPETKARRYIRTVQEKIRRISNPLRVKRVRSK